MTEIWKKAKSFENYYEVSNFGNIRTSYGQVLHPYTNNKGYKCIKFQVNNLLTYWLVHRLIATNFVTNPNNYPCVDHLDSNPQNCRADNLEWVTHKENMQRASQRGRFKNQRNALGFKYPTSTSRYYGVSYDKSRNAWTGVVTLNRTYIARKRFKTEIEAAKYVNDTLDMLNLTDRPRNIL